LKIRGFIGDNSNVFYLIFTFMYFDIKDLCGGLTMYQRFKDEQKKTKKEVVSWSYVAL